MCSERSSRLCDVVVLKREEYAIRKRVEGC